MITATIRLDYDGREAKFDATPWFEQASGAQIRALALCDFGGDYAADNVAHALRSVYSDIDNILTQSEQLYRAGVEASGFEVYVDPKEALEWLFAAIDVSAKLALLID